MAGHMRTRFHGLTAERSRRSSLPAGRTIARSVLAVACITLAAAVAACGGPSKPSVAPPGAPADVVATAGVRSAVVTWSAPGSDMGGPASTFIVTATPGGATATTTATTASVTGLENGTTYTFSVTAANAGGMSPPSQPSPPVTTPSAPGSPVNVAVTAAVRGATITWTAPTDDGGRPITGYSVTLSPATLSATGSVVSTTATVAGLAEGQTYSIAVIANNAVGGSAPSSPAVSVSVPSIAITISPASAAVAVGGSRQFTATVTGWPDVAVGWTASSGTIDVDGMFVAPSAKGSVAVTATSHADPTKTATAEIRVFEPLQSFTVRPSSIQARPGESTYVYVRANHELTSSYTIDGIPATSVVARDTLGSYSVTVTSADDPTKTVVIPIEVRPGTDVSQIIGTDTTWDLSGSPYYVGAVEVADGVTLTIDPGVEVHGGTFDLYGGTISAIGTPTSRIRFFNVTPRFRTYGNSLVALQYVDYFGGNIWGPQSYYGGYSLLDSDFQGGGSGYIWYPRNTTIERCRWMDAPGFDIGVNTGTTLSIKNNLFWRPRGTTISNWARYGGQLLVTANSFYTFGAEIIRLHNLSSNVGMDAVGNFWGTTDNMVIDGLIWDANDSLSAGTVVPYVPVLSEPDPLTPTLP